MFRATPADVPAGVRVGDLSLPAFPGSAVGISDPGAARRLLRAALRPGSRPRRSRCSRATRPATRPPRASTASRSPSRSRSRASRSTMAFLQRVVPAIAQNTPRAAGIDTGTDLLAGFLQDQPRPAPGRTTRRSRRWPPRPRRRCCWREAFSQLGNTAGRVAVRRLPHLLLRGQGDRSAGASRLRPRLDCSRPRSPPPTAASSSTPTTWASTATASSSITAWACSRSTRTCRRWTSRRATRSRRARRSGAPGITGLAGGDHLHFTMLVNGVAGEPGRVVGSALDGRPRVPQDPRGGRQGAGEQAGR